MEVPQAGARGIKRYDDIQKARRRREKKSCFWKLKKKSNKKIGKIIPPVLEIVPPVFWLKK